MDYKKFDELYKVIKESSMYEKYFQCDKGRLMDLTNRKNFRYNWLKWIKLEFNDATKSKIGKKFSEEHYIGIQIYPYFIDCEDICINESKNYSCNDNFPYTKKEYHYISGDENIGMDIDSKTGNIMKKDNKNDI